MSNPMAMCAAAMYNQPFMGAVFYGNHELLKSSKVENMCLMWLVTYQPLLERFSERIPELGQVLESEKTSVEVFLGVWRVLCEHLNK